MTCRELDAKGTARVGDDAAAQLEGSHADRDRPRELSDEVDLRIGPRRAVRERGDPACRDLLRDGLLRGRGGEACAAQDDGREAALRS